MHNNLNYSTINIFYSKYYSKYRKILPMCIVSDSKLKSYCFKKAYNKANK